VLCAPDTKISQEHGTPDVCLVMPEAMSFSQASYTAIDTVRGVVIGIDINNVMSEES
jgi:hypothetical protein